uniref:hypothetical protein n=1 Tax=uncultured Jatrophihabitans sp. TaxID=1610747 RepID=UPI0035CB3384
MIDDNDDLAAALRRELASAQVRHDDERAAAMIGTATEVTPLGDRHWQAPVAAAAAVVVIGGGVAAFAATRG